MSQGDTGASMFGGLRLTNKLSYLSFGFFVLAGAACAPSGGFRARDMRSLASEAARSQTPGTTTTTLSPSPTTTLPPSPTTTLSPSTTTTTLAGGACLGRDHHSGPLSAIPQVHPQDSRRFEVSGKQWIPAGTYGFAVNMMGRNEGNTAMGSGKTLAQAMLDQAKHHIDLNSSRGLDLVRWWFNWGALSGYDSSNPTEDWDGHVLPPYARSGTSGARDGGKKLNLNQWNPEYWQLVRDTFDYAASKGLVIQALVLDCWHSGQYGEKYGLHDFDFFRGTNNINGVNFTSKDQWFQTSGPVWNEQAKFIDKFVSEVGGYKNLIWETCNENTHSQAFDEAVATRLRNQEVAQGKAKHLIVGRNRSGFANIQIPEHMRTAGHKTPYPNKETSETMRSRLVTSDNGGPSQWSWGMPLITDNDCCMGEPDGNAVRKKFWMAITGGAHVSLFNNEIYKKSVRNNSNTQNYVNAMGRGLGFLKQKRVDFIGMTPAPNNGSVVAANTAYAIQRPGQEYLVYFPAGGSTSINGISGVIESVWFNPRTGVTQAGPSSNSFQAPDSQDWVLYVRKKIAGCPAL